MDTLLSNLRSPKDLQGFSQKELLRLAGEMREAICRVSGTRTAHFASNLGVIELALALHTSFDFSRDRLIWDTGHQVYAHKMLTGRYDQFVIDVLRSANFWGGVLTQQGATHTAEDLFTLRRVRVHGGDSLDAFVRILNLDW